MRKIKKFQKKKITIRFLEQADIKKAEKFRKFINELIDDETAFIKMKTKKTLKQEKEWIGDNLKEIKKHQTVMLAAEENDKIVAAISISLKPERQSHIGEFAISMLKDCRGIGLGKYLMKEILKLGKNKLKPKPLMIRLGVYSTNKIAVSLYKKTGFEIIAKIPNQFNFNGKLFDETIMLKKL